jgi:translation initiation factor IF-1
MNTYDQIGIPTCILDCFDAHTWRKYHFAVCCNLGLSACSTRKRLWAHICTRMKVSTRMHTYEQISIHTCILDCFDTRTCRKYHFVECYNFRLSACSTHKHLWAHTCTRMKVSTRMQTYEQISIHTCIQDCVHAHTCRKHHFVACCNFRLSAYSTHKHLWAHTCTRMKVSTCMHTYEQICTWTYVI